MSTIDKFQIKWLAAEGDNNFIYTLCPKQDINAFHFYVHRGYYNGNRTTEAQCGEVARRLMACWHACDGIPTEALEKGRMSPDAFEANESRADKAEAQVDKLLDALKLAAKINPFGSVENAKARDAAIAAIANVEASQE